MHAQQREIREVFPSYYCVRTEELLLALSKLKNDNKKGEYYLTDIYAILRKAGKKVIAVQAVTAEDVIAPNTRQQLAEADAAMQERIQRAMRESGVTIVSGVNTYIEAGVTIGPDTVIQPFTFIGRDSTIGADCVIGPFANLPRGKHRAGGSTGPRSDYLDGFGDVWQRNWIRTNSRSSPAGPIRSLAQKICDYLQIPLGRGRTDLFPGWRTDRPRGRRRARAGLLRGAADVPSGQCASDGTVHLDRHASPGQRQRVTAVIPYFGYARQDQKDEGRTPITAKLVANLLERAGADRVVSVDLHAAQVQGFFDIPVDHLNAGPVLGQMVQEPEAGQSRVCVSPDVGNVKRAQVYAELLGGEICFIDKRRKSGIGHRRRSTSSATWRERTC